MWVNRQHDPRSCLVHPVDRFDSEEWFSCNQVIFILIAYFLGNTCAKNYRNGTVYVKIIASQSGTFFETRCSLNKLSAFLTIRNSSFNYKFCKRNA